MQNTFMRTGFFRSALSIRAKLIIIFLTVSIIPLLIISFVSYRISFQSIQDSSVENFANLADQLNKNIELVLMDSRNFLKISQSEEVQRFLTKSTDSETEYTNAMAVVELFKTYRDLFDFDEFIDNIVILNNQGCHISERRGVYDLPVSIKDLSIVKRIEQSPDELTIIPNNNQDYVDPVTQESYLSICSVLRKPVTHEEIGYIIVDLDMDVIYDLVTTISLHPPGDFFIVENEDSIVAPFPNDYQKGDLSAEHISLIKQNERGFFNADYHGVSSFFVFNTLQLTGWKIIGRTDRKDLLASAIVTRNIAFTIGAATAGFLILIYLFISYRLTHPIRKLKNCMREVEEGNLDLRAEVSSHDEIADLSESFNSMVQRIKELIELTVKEQELAKKMEFKALQAQINPHFLYNSLESILWMAEAGNKEDIITMTKSLSSFFRIILSKGDEKITLRDELSHITSYLVIQKLRYRDILSYEIDVPEELMEYRIIKIVLQPLVENALYHGIKNTRLMGKVRIQGRELEDQIVLIVDDNGVGMSEEKLAELQQLFTSEYHLGTSSSSYGLRNVNQRLKLEYGDNYRLRITSVLGKGTRVIIKIPKEPRHV
jgi:two-component system sensor histidine kinase YesM